MGPGMAPWRVRWLLRRAVTARALLELHLARIARFPQINAVIFTDLDAARARADAADAALERGERLMGFGHRIYRTRDPRADVLKAALSVADVVHAAIGIHPGKAPLFSFEERVEMIETVARGEFGASASRIRVISFDGLVIDAARTIGADPAVFSNPFISTLVDALGLVVYFFIAQAVLGI